MEKYLIVKKHIDAMDYCSLLSVGAPNDEFDTESQIICDKITCALSVQDIAQIIAEVFNQSFSHSDATSRFVDCAKKIFADLHC